MICEERTVWHGTGKVRENVQIAEQTFRLAVEIPHCKSDGTINDFPEIQAGQFVMLRLPRRSDPLLGRPLAVYRTTSTENATLLEVVYIVVGKMTARLAEVRSGDELELWAPLGRGFGFSKDQHAIMVAGGIGQTPFLQLAAGLEHRTLLYGARSADRLACVEDFEALGVDVRIATEDGSQGHKGFVTDLIRDVYKPGEATKIFCCGPHPMLKAAFEIAWELDLPCEVSLETPMGCGLGICFGCVVPYRTDDGEWDYRRTCVDGPAFDAYRLRWD